MSIPEGGTWDMTVRQGSTFSQVFTMAESDETTPINLTGYTGKAQARNAAGELLIEFTVAITALTGEVLVSATATQTANADQSGLWDLELRTGATVVCPVGGRFLLVRQQTLS